MRTGSLRVSDAPNDAEGGRSVSVCQPAEYSKLEGPSILTLFEAKVLSSEWKTH
jgi:hypothetical protein